MIKSLFSWIIAIVISLLVVWMFWTLFFPLVEFFTAVAINVVMFAIIIFFVAIPIYMVVRKKLIK